jgi:hypothetical protein
MSSLEPTPEHFGALAARPDGEPVVMINLLQFKADGGRESCLRYTHEVAPHLQRAGGAVRYADASPRVVISDGETPWWTPLSWSSTRRPRRSSTWCPTRSTSRCMSTAQPGWTAAT